MPADLPYVLPMVVLVAEESLALRDEGQQTLQSPQHCRQIPCRDGDIAGRIEPPKPLQQSYLTGRSFEVAWEGEVSKAQSTGHWGSSGVSSWTPPLLHIQYITGSHHTKAHGFSYHCYADDTQLYLSFRPDDPTIAAWISVCLADISAWMKEHHLQLNLAKTELLVFPATPTLQHDFTIQLGSSTITPSSSVRNLGVIFDENLTFKDHIFKECSIFVGHHRHTDRAD